MANLATADQVGMLNRTDSILIIQGGKAKRIAADKLSEQINQGDEALLRQVAWGIPIKQGIQSDPHWGTCGNWDLYAEYKAKVGRYLVKPDGTAAKLCRTDSSVYADGTPLDETKGNVMVIGPRLYYRVQDDALAGCPVLWMSESPIGGHWLSNAGEHNCYAAYKGTLDGSRLVSRSGNALAMSKSINQFWAAAQVNGSDWGLVDYDGWRWFCLMCLCEAEGNINIQDAIGYGVGGSLLKGLWTPASKLLVGATKSLGDATGAIAITLTNTSETPNVTGVDCSRVNILGLEDIYGWQWEMTQGIYCGITANASQSADTAYIYKGNRLPTSAELASTPTGEFRTQKRLISSNDTAQISGYISELQIGEYFDILVKSIDGGESTSYWCDYLYCDKTVGQLCMFGGYAVNGPMAGPFMIHCYYNFGFSSMFFGSRLGYYGPLKFTDGRNI